MHMLNRRYHLTESANNGNIHNPSFKSGSQELHDDAFTGNPPTRTTSVLT
jgi:hypothetical protein